MRFVGVRQQGKSIGFRTPRATRIDIPMTSEKPRNAHLSLHVEHGSFIKPSARHHCFAKVSKDILGIVVRLVQHALPVPNVSAPMLSCEGADQSYMLFFIVVDSTVETETSSTASHLQRDQHKIARKFVLPLTTSKLLPVSH
jgi:hypothetical protein